MGKSTEYFEHGTSEKAQNVFHATTYLSYTELNLVKKKNNNHVI